MIFRISLSLFNASIGVRLFTSRFLISSRTWLNTGSSNWKKLNWKPSAAAAISLTGFAFTLPLAFSLQSIPPGGYPFPVVSGFRWNVSRYFSAYRPSWLHGYRNYVRYLREPVYAGILPYLKPLSPKHCSFDAFERTFHLIQFMIMSGKSVLHGHSDAHGYIQRSPRQSRYHRKYLFRQLIERTRLREDMLFRIFDASFISTIK